jgi:hypothetical protein
MHTLPPNKRISARFKNYNRDMKDVWTSFTFIEFYSDVIRKGVKSGKIPKFGQESLSGPHKEVHDKSIDHTYGVADHIAKKVNPDRSFVNAVALTEDFLKDLMVTVLEEYPQKLSSKEALETVDKQYKLLDVILTKDSKEDILSSLIEERVRGIFYGNPTDFFLKDKKMKMGFGTFFSDNHSRNIDFYREITARLNLFAHNNGKVDSKYLREVENSQFRVGRKAMIDREYLRHVIITLRGLSATAAGRVNLKLFNQDRLHGVLQSVYTPFNKFYSDASGLGDKYNS